nr:hypothetical protein B0A51_05344 [Rachicladosporium sp. CCFEE 5018]
MDSNLATAFAKLSVFGASPPTAHTFSFELPGLRTTAFSDSMTERSLAKWPTMLQPACRNKKDVTAGENDAPIMPLFPQYHHTTLSLSVGLSPKHTRPVSTKKTKLADGIRKEPFPLLRLPAELRLVIYDMLFAWMLDQITLPAYGCYPLPPLFRVCRLIRAEVSFSWKFHLTIAKEKNDTFVDFVLAQTLQEGDGSVLRYSHSGKHANKLLNRAQVHQADLAALDLVASCVRRGITAKSAILRGVDDEFDGYSRSQFLKNRRHGHFSDSESNSDA